MSGIRSCAATYAIEFERVFAGQVQALGRPSGVLFGIRTPIIK